MTAAIEAAYKRLYGLELDLSEQYLQHVQKIQWLNGMAMLPAAEVQSETNGGGNLTWHVGVLQRYGIPLESQLPYVGAANYQDTNQAGDIPSGLDSATLTQKALDDFILSEGRNDLIPEALNHAVLPQTALAGARYRPLSVTQAPRPNELFWYKRQLAAGREVAISLTLRGPVPWRLTGVWNVPPAPTCNPAPCPADPVHALVIAGYDDVDRVFLIKNSWGSSWTPSTFLGRLSYDWIEQGFVREAISILDVADPSADFGVRENAQLLMGRWSIDYNGRRGTLDVYRVAGDGTGAQLDRRTGTLFQDDGTAFRVNANVTGQQISLRLDWSVPNLPTDALSGSTFTGFLFSAGPRVLAGSYVDQRDGNTYPFAAWKGFAPLAMAGTQQLGLTTYKGRWALDYDGTTRELDINGVNAQTRALDATILDNAGRAVPVSGTVRADPREVTFQFTGSGATLVFQGQLATARLGLMAGTYSQGSSGTRGFYARRLGNVPPPGADPPTAEDRLCFNKPWQCRP